MTEIKIASVGADAKSNMQLDYITEKVINQEALGESISGQLAKFETIGKFLSTMNSEQGEMDERAIDYMRGQGEGMLRVVAAIKLQISFLKSSARLEREWNE